MQDEQIRGGQRASARQFWPSPQDYSEAVQTAAASFVDEELRQGRVETTNLDLPRSVSGNFATVFCFRCPQRKVAVRCFLHNIPHQQERYHAISQYVLNDGLPCTVPFEYVPKGIKIHGEWYPILKMEWVEGVTLKQFIETNLGNSMALNLLGSYFKEMTLSLTRCGVAHGDLQHDNIMISSDELRLVDYDGMYVPALSGRTASELGHPNYQHPHRCEKDFGPHLDNFSAWVIYASLKALSRDPSLWPKLNANGECLLFRRSDFEHREVSQAFALLTNHSDAHVRYCSSQIFDWLDQPLESVPCLANACESSGSRAVFDSTDTSSLAPLVVRQTKSGDRAAGTPTELSAGAAIVQSAAHVYTPQNKTVPASTSLFGRLTDPDYPQYTLIRIDADTLYSSNLDSAIRRQLGPGEGLYWIGSLSPLPSAYLRIFALIVWLILIVSLLLASVLILVVSLVTFVVLLVITMMIVPIIVQARPRTLVLTNQRIILITAESPFKIKSSSLPLDNIEAIDVSPNNMKSEDAVLVLNPKQSSVTPRVIAAKGKRQTVKEFIERLPPSVRVEGKL